MRKDEINNLIAIRCGFKPPHMSTGSTESKELFLLIDSSLGLGLNQKLSKPNLARAIVEASGLKWDPSCESSVSTVTKEGMLRVLSAVEFFKG